MSNQGEVIYCEDPVHGFFGLTYSSYLVLPRTLLQSAPVPWQKEFVRLLHELEQMFPGMGEGSYWVRKQEGGKFIEDPLRDYQRGRRRIQPVLPPRERRDPDPELDCEMFDPSLREPGDLDCCGDGHVECRKCRHFQAVEEEQ